MKRKHKTYMRMKHFRKRKEIPFGVVAKDDMSGKRHSEELRGFKILSRTPLEENH